MKKELRERVHRKYAGHCAYCGANIEIQQMQVDHIIPKERWHIDGRFREYNRDDFENLNPACRYCNNWKHSKRVEEFRADLEAQIERARKYSRNFRMAERYGLISVNMPKVKFYFEAVEVSRFQ